MDNPLQQRRPVSGPLNSDKQLLEYSGNIQDNFADLFSVAHDHVVSSEDQAAYAALSTDAERIAFIAQYIGLV